MKVKCISSDVLLDGYYTPGRVYRLRRERGKSYRTVKSNRGVDLGVIHDPLKRGRFFVAGFERCVFDSAPHRFVKRNQSAALGQIEIDYTRCKRSIRNQARNIAKEHFSCGKLEKIARGYKR